MHKPYKTRVRMPSMLDPHVENIERWLGVEPQLTAITILGRLAKRAPGAFGPPQHTTVQRLLKALRRKAAAQPIAGAEPVNRAPVASPAMRAAATASASAAPAFGNIPP